tara:strand:+ start:3357 stop:3614 length:258 start_codon:yes stop_codon:yes gene_type:complete
MKIKEEQLSKIQEQQQELNSLFSNVGFLESQKHNLLHKISTVSQTVDEYKMELEKEYGSVNINVNTGEYTAIEAEESNLKVVENA